MLLFIGQRRLKKSEQMALFAPSHVKGSVRKDGTVVRPYVARRPHKPMVAPAAAPARELKGDALNDAALNELAGRLRQPGDVLSNPTDAKRYVQLKLAGSHREVFAAFWLDSQHRMIAFQELSHGTINAATVHPREVVREAMNHNAAAVVFAHNHPSGVAEPSPADRALTQRLKDLLALIDVRVLDHFVVGGAKDMQAVSFADRGWL